MKTSHATVYGPHEILKNDQEELQNTHMLLTSMLEI